jgi:hypothetical protein
VSLWRSSWRSLPCTQNTNRRHFKKILSTNAGIHYMDPYQPPRPIGTLLTFVFLCAQRSPPNRIHISHTRPCTSPLVSLIAASPHLRLPFPAAPRRYVATSLCSLICISVRVALDVTRCELSLVIVS